MYAPIVKEGFQVKATYWSQVISASSETGPENCCNQKRLIIKKTVSEWIIQ